ncbi:MAG TPA: T9SS type A sorting domain-containing protein [bacterium]|nr:T9SS type A sorting domain-containing protein [bacterium]HMW32423.1 T9SS type A sorting domain-containing protein [bacterium]HMW34718.1 T9SS type A sorting domain-containing protein [bacterium]HMY36024.1 T9SS type A sorting domain-containing protein [bacterium]HMZ03099.1 T9SS type A sorting domain-containing protein [bacterium]
MRYIRVYLFVMIFAGGLRSYLSAQEISLSGDLQPFSVTAPGAISDEFSYAVSATGLSGSLLIHAPHGFEISTTSGGVFGSNITLPETGGEIELTTIYVRFAPSVTGSYDSVIVHESGVTQTLAVTGLCAFSEPTLPPSDVVFSGIDSSAMTITWQGGDGDYHLVLVRADALIELAPNDGQSITANSTFGSGTDIGGNTYAVFAGSGTSVSINGLSRGVNYYFSVFTYNGTGNDADYLTDAAVGEQTTLSRPPERIQMIRDTTFAEDSGTRTIIADLHDIFSDPENNLLTFSAGTLVSGADAWVTDNTLEFFSSEDSSGLFEVIVEAQDNSGNFVYDTLLVTVTQQNDAPKLATPIGPKNLQEDFGKQLLAYLPLVFHEADGEAMTFSIHTPSPYAALMISGDSLYALSQNNLNGQSQVIIEASDPTPLSNRDTFQLQIIPINDPPARTSVLRDTSFAEDFSYRPLVYLPDYYSDPDDGVINFSSFVVNTGVEGYILNDSLYVEGNEDFFGSAALEIRASDGNTEIRDTIFFTITPVNDAPSRIFIARDTSVQEDAARTAILYLPMIFLEPDLEPVSYGVALSNIKSVAAISGDTLYVTPLKDSTGSVEVYLSATDPTDLSAKDTLVLQIVPVNDRPVRLATISDTTLPQNFGKVLIKKLSTVFYDADHTALSFSFVKFADGVDPLISNDSLYLRSTVDFFGNVSVRVIASDGEFTVSDTFRVVVQDNTAPVAFLAALSSPLLQRIRFALGSNETIASAALTANGQVIDIESTNGVYFGDYSIESVGVIPVVGEVFDLAGNKDTIRRSYTVTSLDKKTTYDNFVFEGNQRGYLVLDQAETGNVPTLLRPLSNAVDVLNTASSAEVTVHVRYQDHLSALRAADENFDEGRIGVYAYENHQWQRLSGEGRFGAVETRIHKNVRIAVFYDPEYIMQPKTFALDQNYPNPFNPSTTIRFAISQPGHTTLKVYNMLGQEVRTLFSEYKPAGNFETIWDGKNEKGLAVASGVYLYRLSSGSFTQTRRMVLVK